MSADSPLSQIRKIDTRRSAPFATIFMIGLTLLIFYWFFRGGSFRLYASIFFGLYFITRQIWVSVLLIGIIQNIAFLPLHFIWLKMSTSMQSFEDEIDAIKAPEEQYIVFQQKVKKGDFAASFYIFSFIVNAIAFFSAGRVFLIDFYTKNLDPKLIYSFIPYPEYPLQGELFKFPFYKVTGTTAINWQYIFFFWLSITIFFAVLRLLWRFLKLFLSTNPSVLKFRIGYNRILLAVGGVGLTILILSTILLRHLPTQFSFTWLIVDLSHQNTPMNFITAVGTFLTTLMAGYKHNSIASTNLRQGGVSEEVIEKIFRDKMRQSLSNGLLLGAGAFFITNQIPSAFELSVAMFELLYIISPYTFDRFLVQVANKSSTKTAVATSETAPAVTTESSEKK
jgi:hypothetical protein